MQAVTLSFCRVYLTKERIFEKFFVQNAKFQRRRLLFSEKAVSLQRVFHSIRFKVNKVGIQWYPIFFALLFRGNAAEGMPYLILFFASPYWMCSTGKPEGANVQSIFLFVRAERSTRRAESANVQLIFLFVRAWRSTRRAESPTFSS